VSRAEDELPLPDLLQANGSAATHDAPIEGARPFALPRALQEFFIPVWQQVRVSLPELALINHPAFARLADIYQLGQTHLVYRGATHKRWEHALGTLHAAELLVSAIERNHADSDAKLVVEANARWVRSQCLRPYEVAFVRLAALLHDIGHLSAGHTFEDELGLLDKHDADNRLNHVLDRTKWRDAGEPRTLRELIDSNYVEAANASGLGLTASEILLELISKDRVGHDLSTEIFRMQVCRDIVGNTICADLIDYLHRDWHHLGKPRTFDARLIEYFEIRHDTKKPADARLVLNLRQGAEVRIDAVTAVFELLESRYQLGEIALFHRTKLTASAMLERLVAEIADLVGDRGWFQQQLDHLLECSDEELIQKLVALGEDAAKAVGGAKAARMRRVLPMARALRYRQLHKQVVARNTFDLAGRTSFVRSTLGGDAGAASRLSTCRSLEEDFGLPDGSVVIYCPGAAPHAKIAQVKVFVHGEVQELATLEDSGVDPALTGGLLKAQMNRFDRLWRFQISLSRGAIQLLRSQELMRLFEQTVEALVLNADHGSGTSEDDARALAKTLLQSDRFGAVPKQLVAAGETQAQNRQITFYPSGGPTLSSLIVDQT
jgi:HD superfamily phosphohydrolase